MVSKQGGSLGETERSKVSYFQHFKALATS